MSQRTGRIGDMGVAATELVTPAALVAELRLGLLADLGAVVEDLIDAVERNLAVIDTRPFDGHRVQAVACAVEVRHALHETVGFPGEPLVEQTFTGRGACSLALEVLTERREHHVRRLARDEVPEPGRQATLDTVRLITGFLRSTSSPAAQSQRSGYGC
jgi:hypothetical protein